tara:strand:+ start:116 stop:349 length:234 start_codon:yes stop_codon:yes gene_type:complete
MSSRLKIVEGDPLYFRREFSTLFFASESWGDFYDVLPESIVKRSGVPVRIFKKKHEDRDFSLDCSDEKWEEIGGTWL